MERTIVIEKFDEYLKAAQQGDAEAQYCVGFCYEQQMQLLETRVLEIDTFEEYLDWYRKAAQQGHVDAQRKLGGFLGCTKEGVQWYRKAATQGDAESQYELGLCYKQGWGVAADSDKAIGWFQKAAEQGIHDALYEIGTLYYNYGKNLSEAVKWFREASAKGCEYADGSLGRCYEFGHGVKQDYTEALKYYRKAADEYNDLSAKEKLGEFYMKGMGTEPNMKEALKWYNSVKDRLDVKIQLKLGECFEKGIDIEQDMKKAVEWYTLAAQKGDVHSKFKVGTCYELGLGVKQNIKQAIKWYKEAAEKNDEDAKRKLEEVSMKKGTESGETRIYRNILKKAKQGDEYAQYRLGKIFEQKGEYAEALAWYMKSAQLNSLEELYKYYNFIFGKSEDDFDEEYAYYPGYCEGVCALGNLFFYGKGVEQDYHKAFMCFVLASGEESCCNPDSAEICENGVTNDEDEYVDTIQYYGGLLMQGFCYFEGLGVEQNYEIGFRLLLEAEDNVEDHVELAWRCIGIALLEGKGTEKNEKRAFEFFEFAANCGDIGDAVSQYYIGFCYENGRGVEKNVTAAKEWYQKAAAQGNENAKLKLAEDNDSILCV